MPKVKVARKSTNVDMTAMCDVAFLLLTFFMLATSFKPEEPVAIVSPSSVSDVVVDDKDVMLISIGNDGRVFFSIDNPIERKQLIENVSTTRNLNLNPQQITHFANGSSVGVPFNQLPSILSMTPSQEAEIKQPGIPVDTTTGGDNQLAVWIDEARHVNPQLRIAIKADQNASYPAVQRVIKTFEKMDIHKFNLVTNPEAVPKGSALWAQINSDDNSAE